MRTINTFTSVGSLWNSQRQVIRLDISSVRVHNKPHRAQSAYVEERFQRPSAADAQTLTRGGKEVVS
jgi:hypothetical protein